MNLFELDFNEIDEGVFVANNLGIYIHVNNTGAIMLGYTVKEIIGKSITDVIFEEDYEKLQNHFQLMNEGQRVFEEFDMKRKDGEKIIAELSARKLADGNYLAVLRDITSKKMLESKIVEQKENLERLLNTVPSAVYTVDNKKIVTGWNKRAEILTGYSESEVLGKECMLFACEPCILKCGLLANDVQKPVINRICTIRAKNGEMRQISKNVEAIYDKNGDVVGGIECFEDVTEKLKAEKKLKESQENFHNFFNTIDDMFVVATPEGKILYINRAFSDKLGYNLEELLDMHVLDVHPKEYRVEAEHIFEAMFKGERDFCPLPLQKKDGCYLPVETRVWFGKWDGMDCIYGISKDLSKQQAALEKFHKLFDSNPALMAVSNLPERKFIDVNTSFLEKLGYSREEIIGKSSGDLDLFIEKDKQLKVAELLKEQGNIRNIELKVRKKDGQIMTGLFSGEIIDNQIDKAFLTVMTDITEQKDAQDELIIAKEKAEAASIAKSQFLANMSHEIRTPMNGIMGFLELLNMSNLSEEQRMFIKEAKTSSDVLLYLINDILDISKIEAGKMSIENTAFCLRSVVEDAVSVMVPKANEKKLGLHVFIKPNVPEKVVGDPARVRQVLNNLISNAVKFTHIGEVTVIVEMISSSKNEEIIVKFEVRDTGIGIDKEVVGRLFQPFVQADGSTTRKYGGTGLGLAISKELVKMMGGEIEVESGKDKGSVFSFTVIFKKCEQDSNEKPYKYEKFDNVGILIVDDNKNNRQIVRSYLEEAGAEIFEVESGEKAITKLIEDTIKDKKIKIAIVDFQMPEMNGTELAVAINAIPSIREVKLVLLTSVAQSGDAAKAKEAGFSGYLSKPVKRDELIHCIYIVLGLEKNLEDETPIITRHLERENRRVLKPKILLVEDNEVNRKVVSMMLKNNGLECDVAYDGIEGLVACKEKEYDVVFMDCQMPKMDGYEATRRIREFEGMGRHTAIIAMTANAMEGDRQKCLDAGMDDYISKPIDYDLLLDKINIYCKKRSLKVPTRDFFDESIKCFMKETGFNESDADEVYQDYIKVAGENMKLVSNAMSEEDYEGILRIAHQLKGSSGNLRIHKIMQLAIELENSAKEKNIADCKRIYSEINRIFE